jgi:DNA polymerase-3 subunit epsilon
MSDIHNGIYESSILDGPIVFVDIETNGLNHIRGRVIEVAAIRVEDGQVTATFQSLVDPETELPHYITTLTGITTDQVKKAPTFDQIADDLQLVLQDAVFVAHNVRFDYSFLKQEFTRVSMKFQPKQLCTVKLSRALYPHEKGHKLADLISRHSFSFSNRHRAYDDAAVLWQFISHVRKNFPPEQVENALTRQIKSPSIPKGLDPELVRNLPEGPGVYIFEDAGGTAIYVGKSVTIKKRVLSHFSRDHAETKEFKIAQAVKGITTHQTAGELSALLLESQLIKELQPVYNRTLRRLSKLTLVRHIPDSRGYEQAEVTESNQIDPEYASEILAVYPRRQRAKESLNEITKLYDLCPKLMGLEKATGPCFMYQLKKCRGACIGLEPPVVYNHRLMAAFERQRIQAWPYRGPILLQEISDIKAVTGIIVDQWCIIADVIQEEYCDPVVSTRAKAFDLDTYKILHAHMSRKLDTLRIKRLTPTDLISLAPA